MMVMIIQDDKRIRLASAEVHRDRILIRRSIGDTLQLHWNEFLDRRLHSGQHVEYTDPALTFCLLPN